MKNKNLIIIGLILLSLKSFAQSTPFLGQIAYVTFGYAPKGWAECNGQTLPINQNVALFSLLGTTYGGNGTTTFMLPNIQGRVILGNGQGFGLPNYSQGDIGGEENHTLTLNEMPAHNHSLLAVKANGNTSDPSLGVPADTKTLDKEYSTDLSSPALMKNDMLNNTGGSQPHPNIQPYITFKCIIALQGIYPSRP